MLHARDWRAKLTNDLRKSLLRIPWVEDAKAFWAFCRAGRVVADLHLHYEVRPPPEGVRVVGVRPLRGDESDYDFYSAERIRFEDKAKKDVITYNSRIRIEGIPRRAYNDVVNGLYAWELGIIG